ncbi:hypothetical protein QTP88_005876 [Uroleucon formosanum]
MRVTFGSELGRRNKWIDELQPVHHALLYLRSHTQRKRERNREKLRECALEKISRGDKGDGAAASCSLQATLRHVSSSGVNWRLEWSRVVGGGSWEGMRLHLQWWRWGEPGHWVGMARRGPLHPGATRKMLRNFGERGDRVASGRGPTLASPMHRLRDGYFGDGTGTASCRSSRVVVGFFNSSI